MGVHRLPDRLDWRRRETSRAVERLDGRGVDRDAFARAWDRDLSAVLTPAPLTQSWAWGDVQAASGWEPVRLEVPGTGVVLVLTQQVGPLRWGYVPRGPADCGVLALEALIDWSRRAGLARLRIEPQGGPGVSSLLGGFGFRRAADVQPSRTRIVRLCRDQEMLASFKRTTRYNIRLAERSGVTVDEGSEAGELAGQVAASAGRAGVSLPGRAYFEMLLALLKGSRTFVARHGGEALCATFIALHDGRAYYLYSGSNRHKSQLKAMDLMMFRTMQYAARSGCGDYDLWGITTSTDPAHPWYGFSEFKRGFGGEVVEYTGTWDLTLSTASAAALDLRERTLHAYRRMRSRGARALA
jgi:lipid II:glycine glycyltransferase (peptidoglycan interpeptide bridge formation enzyme)